MPNPVLILKNIPQRLFNAITPVAALESDVFALPAVATTITAIGSVTDQGATFEAQIDFYISHYLEGPFILAPGGSLALSDASLVYQATVVGGFIFCKAHIVSVTDADDALVSVSIVAKE